MGGIRLFLALAVALAHFREFEPAHTQISGLYTLGVGGANAVLFFYAISGFLISTVLAEKYPADRSGTSSFYKARFVRIFSLYWPVLAVATAIDVDVFQRFAASSWPDRLTQTFLFGIDWRIPFADYPNWHWQAAPARMHPAWTLGAELTFYLLAPFLLRSARAIAAVLAIWFCLRLTLALTIGYSALWSFMFFPATIGFFLLGHLARVAAAARPMLASPLTGCLLLGCALAASLAGMALQHAPAWVWGWDGILFWISVLCFAASLPGVFAATKDNRFLNFLGDLSFPVYLTHMLMLAFTEGLILRLLETGSPERAAGIFILLVLAVAVGTHILLEKPANIGLHFLLATRRREFAFRLARTVQ